MQHLNVAWTTINTIAITSIAWVSYFNSNKLVLHSCMCHSVVTEK